MGIIEKAFVWLNDPANWQGEDGVLVATRNVELAAK